MASMEDEDPGSGSASNTNWDLDWDLFDQSIKDVLGLGTGGAKRNCDSASNSQDSSGESLALVLPAKRKKTEMEDEEHQEQEQEVAEDWKEQEKKEDQEHKEEEDEKDEKEKGQKEDLKGLARDLLFSCAACGLEAMGYKELEKHVQDDHQVGDDQEMVLASIRLPNNQEALTTFQCGVKTCGKQFVGLKEVDLKKHIKVKHGECNVQERNIIRICRVCSGKFSSDEELAHHIQVWHNRKLFANGKISIPPARLSHSDSPDLNRNVIIRPEEDDEPQPRRTRKRSKDRGKKRKRKTSKSEERKVKEFKERLEYTDVGRSRYEEESFQEDAKDLKYKLKKFREKYCEACELRTSDWGEHQLRLEHRNNNKKKMRCLYCPKRFLHFNLKSHLVEHPGCSFTCNVTPHCSVSLVGISRMVDHLNANHKKSVRSLIKKHGIHWENSVSHLSRDLSSLMTLPSDLRRMNCRKCDLSFLSQDQSALEEHFRLLHPDLNSTQYSENIVYSCRVCNGVVFGSEKHLLHHIQDDHQTGGSDSPPSPALKSVVVVPKEVPVVGRFLKEKSKNPPSFSADPDQEDLDLCREIISKIKNKKKLKKAPKINTFKTKKVRSNDVNTSNDDEGEDSTRKEPGPGSTEVICHFCDVRMFQSQLSSHLAQRHQTEMFSCDGSCGREVFSPWQERLLHHLRRDHCLAARTDQDLLDQHLRLPASLEMIRCRGGTCEKVATFLGRHLSILMEQTLLKHSKNKHRGQSVADCFVFGCRVCPRVWSMEEMEAWAQHCRHGHTTGSSGSSVEVKEKLRKNNNQLAGERPERHGTAALSPLETPQFRDDENIFSSRMSGCQEGSEKSCNPAARNSRGCEVVRHLKEDNGKEISLPETLLLMRNLTLDQIKNIMTYHLVPT